MLKTKPNEFTIDYVDNSSICKFNRCPAAYCMSRKMGLVKKERMMIALDYGTDIHEAVPYMYNRETVAKGLKIFRDRWEERGYGFKDDKRNIETAERTLENFANQHIQMCPYEIVQFPDISCPDSDRISENEVAFLIDVGADLCLAGRIDAPVRWKADGSLFALDYKTSSEVSNRFFNNFEGCSQAITYTVALSQLTNETVRGFIVEAIRTSKKNAECQMHMVFIKEHQIRNYLELVKRTAEEILKCNETGEWEQRCTGCAPYSMFGSPGYLCDYTLACDSPNPHDMFKFYDKKEPFNPFKIERI